MKFRFFCLALLMLGSNMGAAADDVKPTPRQALELLSPTAYEVLLDVEKETGRQIDGEELKRLMNSEEFALRLIDALRHAPTSCRLVKCEAA